jgi:hypothetical protein
MSGTGGRGAVVTSPSGDDGKSNQSWKATACEFIGEDASLHQQKLATFFSLHASKLGDAKKCLDAQFHKLAELAGLVQEGSFVHKWTRTKSFLNIWSVLASLDILKDGVAVYGWGAGNGSPRLLLFQFCMCFNFQPHPPNNLTPQTPILPPPPPPPPPQTTPTGREIIAFVKFILELDIDATYIATELGEELSLFARDNSFGAAMQAIDPDDKAKYCMTQCDASLVSIPDAVKVGYNWYLHKHGFLLWTNTQRHTHAHARTLRTGHSTYEVDRENELQLKKQGKKLQILRLMLMTLTLECLISSTLCQVYMNHLLKEFYAGGKDESPLRRWRLVAKIPQHHEQGVASTAYVWLSKPDPSPTVLETLLAMAKQKEHFLDSDALKQFEKEQNKKRDRQPPDLYKPPDPVPKAKPQRNPSTKAKPKPNPKPKPKKAKKNPPAKKTGPKPKSKRVADDKGPENNAKADDERAARAAKRQKQTRTAPLFNTRGPTMSKKGQAAKTALLIRLLMRMDHWKEKSEPGKSIVPPTGCCHLFNTTNLERTTTNENERERTRTNENKRERTRT